jgi:SAM-dependent methyltransferase
MAAVARDEPFFQRGDTIGDRMGHRECFEFGERNLRESDILGKDILEVGAHMDGGTMRPYVESFHPRRYMGIDIQAGPGVDMVCDVNDLLTRFGKESFDVLIANELMGHIRDWRNVIHIFKRVLRPGGVLVLTTRSKGFPFHGAPFDFWRYEIEDMNAIFDDFSINAVEADTRYPGVFIAARKPANFKETDIAEYELHSILKGRRVREVSDFDIYSYEVRNLGFTYFVRFRGVPFLWRQYLSKTLSARLKRFFKTLLRA